MKILATEGDGYAGSHCPLQLSTAGHEVAVVDNFSNGSRKSLSRVQGLTGKCLYLEEIDLVDLRTMKDRGVRKILFSSSATRFVRVLWTGNR